MQRICNRYNHLPETEVPHADPPLPESGLPDGWSMEQWVHYGQQYLDRLGNHP